MVLIQNNNGLGTVVNDNDDNYDAVDDNDLQGGRTKKYQKTKCQLVFCTSRHHHHHNGLQAKFHTEEIATTGETLLVIIMVGFWRVPARHILLLEYF